jgi:stress response protein YsnF
MERDGMATSVISAFDDRKIAGEVVDALLEAGLKSRDVEILEGGEDELVGEIVGRGYGEDDARDFAEAAGRGKRLVAARVPEEKVERVVAIMERREAEKGEAPSGGRGETVQAVEEELSVGRRRVATGGVRVTSHVTETPVEETVRLREEHVEARRERADRVLSPEEAEAAFEERTVEAMGTGEEAVVRKEARVVGEVSVGRRVEEREETVRDTVRRSEVEVEEVGAASGERK